MSVKVKTKNKIVQDQRLTLDAIHLKQIKKFQMLQKSIPQKRKEISKLEEQIKKLQKDADAKKDDFFEHFELMDQKRILDLKIQSIEKEIKDIESNRLEEDYLLDVGHIMTQYYINRDNHQSQSDSSSSNITPIKKINKKNKDVFSLFDNYKNNQSENELLMINENDEINDINTNQNANQQQNQFIEVNNHNNSQSQNQTQNRTQYDSKDINIDIDKETENMNYLMDKYFRREKMSKLDIYNHVMSKLDDDFVPEDIHETSENDECPFCETDRELYQNEGKLVCPKCFYVDFILIDSDKPSYRDTPKEMTNFAYKRRNHFIEVLSQYQGRETTEIPEEVYVEILQELKKNRITKVSDLTNVKLRSILKKIEQNRYYEHIPFIIYQLTGLKPPTITSKVRKRLIEMFNDIQIPFAKYCPTERRNFLSYSYILYKFFELLELDEHLPYLNLLKSRDKLHQQDVIWEKICEDLRWEYIPSV
jgi:hypothetical protein